MSITETGSAADTAPTPAKKERWSYQWKELFSEVITSGLCTGCAGCVISCPHDVIGYNHSAGEYKPFHIEEELGLDNCIHGEKGCTSCTRACPRFRLWEPQADEHLHGRTRNPDEMVGVYDLTSATGRMTARHLGLAVEIYDMDASYESVKDKWIGLGAPLD